MMEFHWFRERLCFKKSCRGTVVIGRDRTFARELHDAAYDDLVTHYGRFAGVDPQITDAHRALLGTHHLRRRLAETNRERGVGGMYQVLTFGPYGVQTVPYFFLDHVAPGYGTYVAMRIDNGEWVQEHRPTNTIMRLKTPWDIDLAVPPRRDIRFDSSVRLDPTSPGVIPRQNPEVTFSLYKPPEVPEAIRPSWGDAPLAPLTYVGAYREFNGRPRWPAVS